MANIQVEAFGQRFEFPETATEDQIKQALTQFATERPEQATRAIAQDVVTGAGEAALDVASEAKGLLLDRQASAEAFERGATGVAESVIGGARAVGEAVADPVGTAGKVAASARSLFRELVESSPELGLSIGAGAAATAGVQRAPFISPEGRVGGALVDAAEITGAATGRQIQGEDETIGQSFTKATIDQAIGKVMTAFGKRLVEKKRDAGALLEDNIARREYLSESGESVDVRQAAEELLGGRLPVVAETKTTLSKKAKEQLIEAASFAAEDSVTDSAFLNVGTKITEALANKFPNAAATAEVTANALQQSLVSAVDKRSKALGVMADSVNQLASKSNARIKVNGLTQVIEDEVVKAGILIGDEAAAKTLKSLRPFFYQPNGIPRKELTLREWATVRNKLDSLSGSFEKGSDIQKNIDGVTKRIKDAVFKPMEAAALETASKKDIGFELPDGGLIDQFPEDFSTYAAGLAEMRETASQRGQLLNTRLSGRVAGSEARQMAKALSAKEILKAAETSVQSFDTAIKVADEASPKVGQLVRDDFLRGVYSDLKLADGANPKNIEKALGTPQRPTAKAEILAKHYPDVLRSLENTRLVMDQFQGVAGAAIVEAGRRKGLDDEAIAQNLTRFGFGTVAGQALIAGTAKVNIFRSLANKAKRKLSGGNRINLDEPIMTKLTGEEGERIIRDAMRTRFEATPEAAEMVRKIMTQAGSRWVVDSETWSNIVNDYNNVMSSMQELSPLQQQTVESINAVNPLLGATVFEVMTLLDYGTQAAPKDTGD